MFGKVVKWYNEQSPTVKGFLWLGILLIIGIILRWETIITNISKGFEFFNTK